MTADRENLIKNLIKDGYLKTPLIIEAFRNVDRKDFIPEELKTDAYINTALPIGYGQTISQPLTVAFMLELLRPQPGEKILDVGAGSGWKAALLAYCVSKEIPNSSPCGRSPAGRQFPISKSLVVTIERILELKEMAERNIAKYNFIEKGVVKVVLGDGANLELLIEAGGGELFDKIIAGAAGKEIPRAWKDLLKIGGRIVAPVEHSILTLDKIDKDKFEKKEFLGFSFVPLIREKTNN